MRFYLFLPKCINDNSNPYVILYNLTDSSDKYCMADVFDTNIIITNKYCLYLKDQIIEITDQELLDKYNKMVVFK